MRRRPTVFGGQRNRMRASRPLPRNPAWRDVAQDLGLDREAEGERGPVDVLGRADLAVDAEHVAGVALEEHLQVGGPGVAAGEGGEDAALGRQDGEPAALLGEQGGGLFAGDVVGDEARQHRHSDRVGGHRRGGRVGEQPIAGGVAACAAAFAALSAAWSRPARRARPRRWPGWPAR